MDPELPADAEARHAVPDRESDSATTFIAYTTKSTAYDFDLRSADRTDFVYFLF